MFVTKSPALRALIVVTLTLMFLVPTSIPVSSGPAPQKARAGDFTITALPNMMLTTGQGGNFWWLIEITSTGGFNSEITLSVPSLPANTNSWFLPSKVTPPANGKVSAFFRLNTTATTPAGWVDLDFTGTAGALTHHQMHHATVTSGPYVTPEETPFEQSAAPGETVVFYIKLIACKGFEGTTSLFPPSDGGLAGTYVYDPLTPASIPKDSIVLVKLSITIPVTAVAKDYLFMSSGMTGPTININWSIGMRLKVVPTNGVSIGGRPWMQSIAPGEAATFTFEIVSHGTFNAKADLSQGQPLPADITTTFSPTSVTPVAGGKNFSSLTVSTSDTTAPGIYLIMGKVDAGALSNIAIVYLWVTDTPDYSIRGTPDLRNVVPGSKVNFTLAFSSLNDFTGDLDLSVQSPPKFSTVQLSSAKVNIKKESVVNAYLNLTAGASTPLGRYTIRILASSANLLHYVDVELDVVSSLPQDFTIYTIDAARTSKGEAVAYSFNLESLNGFTGNVALRAEGAPTGSVAAFDQATVLVPNGGKATATLTVTPSGLTPYGTFVLRGVGDNKTQSLNHGAEIVFKLLPHPGVALVPSQDPLNALAGGYAEVKIKVSGTHGFSGSVDFSAVALPAGFSATFTPLSVVADGETLMNLTVADTVAPGLQGLNFNAKNTTALFPCVLQVNVQNFSLSKPAGLSLLVGTFGKFTITGSGSNGFVGTVGLSVQGVPAGVTKTHPATLAVPGAFDLGLTVGTNTQPGKYDLTVSGSFNGTARTVVLELAVTNFTLEAGKAKIALLPGETEQIQIKVLSVQNFSKAVQLGVSGPGAITMSLNLSAVIAPGSALLTIRVPKTMPFGKYILFVNGTFSGQLRSAPIELTVHGFRVLVTPVKSLAGMGGHADYSINVTSEEQFGGDVGLTLSELPPGTTGTFGSPTVKAGTVTTLRIDAGQQITSGTYYIIINGTCASYTVLAQTPLTLANITLLSLPNNTTVVRGLNATYIITLGGQVTATDTVHVTVTAPQGAQVSSPDFTLTRDGAKDLDVTTKDLAVGNYTIVLTSDVGYKLELGLKVQDFQLVVDPTTISIAQGGKATVSVKLNPNNGFFGPATLALDPLPAGIVATLKPLQLGATQTSLLNIEVDSTALVGSWDLVIKSTDPVVRKVTFYINVTKGLPTFDLTVTPDLLKIHKGSSGNYLLKTQGIKGAKIQVSLDVQGLPPGAVADWTAADKIVETPNNKDLTIKVAKTAVVGKYTLTFIATSGAFEVRKNVTLEITKAKTTSTTGDNSMLLLGLVLGIIMVIAVVGALVYILGRKKMRAAAEEPLERTPRTRPSEMERYDTEGGEGQGRPEPPRTRPSRVQRSAPVLEETVPEEPAPLEQEPAPVEEELVQTQETAPEEPQEVEVPPEEVPQEAPEPKKEEESIDDILKKLKGN
jgi:uncharacterized membrane protein